MKLKCMTLGELIDALESVEDKAREVVFGFCELRPGKFRSWRGAYEDLAIDCGTEPVTVAHLLKQSKACLGKEFGGYKGGAFCMHRDVRVWIDEYGVSTGTALVAVDAPALRLRLPASGARGVHPPMTKAHSFFLGLVGSWLLASIPQCTGADAQSTPEPPSRMARLSSYFPINGRLGERAPIVYRDAVTERLCYTTLDDGGIWCTESGGQP